MKPILETKEKEASGPKRKAARLLEGNGQHGKRSKKYLAKELLTGLHKPGREPDIAELRKERTNRERQEKEKTREFLRH